MQVADLIQEDGAAMGGLELADFELVGAREGAALVPEQLALEKLARHGRAVHLDEGPRAPGGEMVDRPGDEVLPGAGLAGDEHRDVDSGGLVEDLACIEHLWATPEIHLTGEPSGRLLRS